MLRKGPLTSVGISVLIIVISFVLGVHRLLPLLTNSFAINLYHTYKKPEHVSDIILVNIKDLPVDLILDQAEIMAIFGAKVIGIDYWLESDKLDSVFDKINYDNIILPSDIYLDASGFPGKVRYSDNLISHENNYGYINLYSPTHFQPFIYVDGILHSHFAAKVVEKYGDEFHNLLLNRAKPLEQINYLGGISSFIDYGDLTSTTKPALEKVRGKIVLLGHYDPDNISNIDRHDSPMGAMYGVVVLANIVSTLLNNYVTEQPRWSILLSATILVLFCPFFIQKLIRHYLWLKAIQIATVTTLLGLTLALLQLEYMLHYNALTYVFILTSEVCFWVQKQIPAN